MENLFCRRVMNDAAQHDAHSFHNRMLEAKKEAARPRTCCGNYAGIAKMESGAWYVSCFTCGKKHWEE